MLALALGLLVVVSWAWIAVMAWDMYGTMQGPAAWMMTNAWDYPHLFLLWAMWAVMMASMMLPSTAPMVSLYVRVARKHKSDVQATARACGLVLGYLLVWAIFSVGATLLQRVLASTMLLSPLMEPTQSTLAPVLLFISGTYQMTPLKRACLRSCRSPLMLFMNRWRPGFVGALRMGITQGLHCLGCCWALMLLLFAAGVMNLFVIAALTLWVLIEKLLPLGEKVATISGVMLMLTGAWLFFNQ